MELFFSEQGTGYPVIFLHGFPFDHLLWEPMKKFLPGDNRFIFPDVRGFGKSLAKKSDYLMEDMAKDIIQLLDAEGVRKAIIGGHSMGGYIALEILRQAPNRLDGIILVASHIYADTEEKQSERFNTIEQIDFKSLIELLEGMPNKLSTDEIVQTYCKKMVEKSKAIGVKGALRAMAKRQSSENLWITAATPKLIIAGDNDQFIKPEIIEKMAINGRNVSKIIIKDAGHMLMREKPEATANALKDFINQIRSR